MLKQISAEISHTLSLPKHFSALTNRVSQFFTVDSYKIMQYVTFFAH